jgi:hypothetical protein
MSVNRAAGGISSLRRWRSGILIYLRSPLFFVWQYVR